MSSKPWTVTRLCLTNLTGTWSVCLAILALVTIPSVIQVVQAGPDEYFERSYLLSSGNAVYAVMVIAPVVVASGHLPKVMHLNATKDAFLAGALLLHGLLAAVVSVVNLAVHYSLDRSWAQTFQVVNIAERVGWTDHGPLVAFVQQGLLLLVVALGVHCLTSLQRSWVGWTLDVVLITLLGLSLVVEPFVSARARVLDLLVLHQSALVQITVCLLAAGLLYGLSRAVLHRREI